MSSYKSTIETSEKQTSWEMFDRIAPTYDKLNRMLSMGIDQMWRKKLARRIPSQESLRLLDLATGTGDQLFMLCNENPNITQATGMDLSEEMMEVGRQKQTQELRHTHQDVTFATGDAQELPLENASFDAASISFGIRNVPDVPKALREMHRVLTPGGKVFILEFGVPKNILFKHGYLFYFRKILPMIGGWVSGDKKAYQYLNRTVEDFPYGDDFCAWMREAGFQNMSATSLSLGIAYLYEGEKV